MQISLILGPLKKKYIIIAPLGAFPKSLGFCSGDPESSLAEIFDFCPKNKILESRYFFGSTSLFYQFFFGDETLSEKPKNGIKNCDFDFGWSKFWSEPSERESKIRIWSQNPRFRKFWDFDFGITFP